MWQGREAEEIKLEEQQCCRLLVVKEMFWKLETRKVLQ